MPSRTWLVFFAAALATASLASSAGAAETVKIGALYPLTGSSAPAGQAAKAAIELGVEIVNNAHPELKGLPLAATAGLPHLGGAKVEIINVDHQGDPSIGQQQTLRLITQDHVAALIGVYHSSVALTATAVAERYGVPFVVADSVAANITQRGFKWTFRVTPIATDFAKAYTDFLLEMKHQGKKVDSVSVLNENTDYGTSVGNNIVAAMKKGGFKVTQIVYNAKSTDVSAQVLQLKQQKPDVAVFVGYTADEILYMKTMHDLDVLPTMIIGDDAGFSDPSFIPAVGDITQGVLDRSAWAEGAPGSVTYLINEMYKKKTGRDLDDTSGRWMQAFFVLCDAIDRAGSTDPAKIQAALKATDLKPAQLMMGYQGVKFDATGQNILASTYLIQLQGKDYKSVWPEARATAKLQWPMKGWKK